MLLHPLYYRIEDKQLTCTMIRIVNRGIKLVPYYTTGRGEQIRFATPNLRYATIDAPFMCSKLKQGRTC